MRGTIFMMVIGASLGLASQAQAGVEDWDTPPQDFVCDDAQGPGHEMCKTYCEDYGCHLDEPYASDKECEHIRDRFIENTGHDLPCEATCPCDALPRWQNAVYGGLEYDVCTEDHVNDWIEAIDIEVPAIISSGFNPFLEGYVCGFDDFTGTPIQTEISSDQAYLCQEQIRDAVTESGQVCVDITDGQPG